VAVVFLYAGGLLYQILYVTLLVILIPGVTYFIQSSLRSAKADVVDRIRRSGSRYAAW
jgi:hypothetical protein